MNSKKVGSIADHDDVVQMVVSCNHRQTLRRLSGIVALGFGNDRCFRHPVGQKIVVPDSALGVAVALGSATKSDHKRREFASVEIERMIQPCLQNGRWPSVVLCRSKDCN